ncbi:hypothetical protein HMI55_006573 [Coelomomyces lativittatus]|nr:hypothetical protein HMI55_006573 [Coelomomyces lativittatus]KAJ1515112.1 hypothetical protein HMI56_006569 [Coelomomyces lativittatus]
MSKAIYLHPLSNFSFAQKEDQPEEDSSVLARLERLRKQYDIQGMRKSVEAILLVYVHHHPHVLLLQIANSFFKLPGDYLKPDEDELEGLKLRLNRLLSKVVGTDEVGDPIFEASDDWDIGECVGQWWRPNFETFTYPYIPAHITEPKERKSVYLVHLPPQKTFWIPKNLKLMAVPLFELYENSSRFGTQIAAVPLLLSRFNYVFQ